MDRFRVQRTEICGGVLKQTLKGGSAVRVALKDPQS